MSVMRERMGATLLVAYASAGLSQVFNQLYFLLIFGYLSIETVGLYSWAIAIATIYAYVMDLGLSTFLMGELSATSYDLRGVIRLILVVRAPAIVLGAVLLLAWAWLMRPAPAEMTVLALVTLANVLQLVDLGLTPWFQVRQQQNALNMINLVLPVCRLLGIGIAVLLGRQISIGFVAALVIGAQLISTAGFLTLALYQARCDQRQVGQMPTVWQSVQRWWLRGPRLTAMYALMVLQARLDWLLVSILLSRVALANYSLANRVVEFAMLVAGVLAGTSFPWLSRNDADEPALRARLALTRRVFACFSALLGVGMFFWVPVLIQMLFGDKYAGAETTIRLMALISAVFMLNQYLVYVIVARRREREYTYLLFAATLLQVAIDVALLPRFGLVGAALGMLVMGVVVHLGQLALCVRDHVIELAEAVRLDALVLTTVAVVGVFWLSSAGPVVGSIVALGLVGGVGGTLLLESGDRRLLWHYAVAMARRSTSKLSRFGANS